MGDWGREKLRLAKVSNRMGIGLDRCLNIARCVVDWEATDDFHPDDTDTQRDFEKNQFLDLRKPLLKQMWEGNFRCVVRPYQ